MSTAPAPEFRAITLRSGSLLQQRVEMALHLTLSILGPAILLAFPHSEGVVHQTLAHPSKSILPLELLHQLLG